MSDRFTIVFEGDIRKLGFNPMAAHDTKFGRVVGSSASDSLAEGISAEAVCDSYALENQRFHDRFTAAEAERDALRSAIWQVLDDMGADGKTCCGRAKAQLRIAYGADDPECPLEYTWEAARDVQVACDEMHGKRSIMRDAVEPASPAVRREGEGT